MSDAAQFRFGIFEFHTSTGELRRDGIPVRLQAQPAKVLTALLEQPGEIVSREALRQAVWGGDTHVDFERGLNFCLAQVRAALDDSTDSPRYIRTVPKRGYQFIAPVGRLPAAEAPPAPPESAKARGRWAIALSLFALALIAVLMAVLVKPAPALRIAVIPFDNETGDPEFDRYAGGLSDLLVADLTTRTGFAIVGNATILRQPRAQRDILAVGASLGAAYVIMGQVQQNAAGRRVLAHLIRLPDQAHVWVSRVDRPTGQPQPTESDLARRMSDEFSRRLPHKTL